ncbi:LOW QUALITY PROTEIN: hypothetical protein Cgig2_030450 [Carnegiea gigantea]|uniref:DUF4283 domain-containing protein n=1 Tax=Carnegiea gigantea TaxID=171969 RepID=A0A9Q1KQR6_9CARY|nr:LOW QUALITY PROTEIN: hypothetical protein Cgig2_030450 [Carnegiea gigantea]
MKRATARGSDIEGGGDVDMPDIVLVSPNVPESAPLTSRGGTLISSTNTLQQNNPNLQFETRQNPVWEAEGSDDVSEDDEPPEEEDPTCPMILLTAAEKRMLHEPWRNALIIKMFDKGIGFLQLKRHLKTKWAMKGDFSLIDIGHDYYVTRFTNVEDYDHVMTNGPWMIGDNCLVIREWIPNFVQEEDTITRLTTWAQAAGWFNEEPSLKQPEEHVNSNQNTTTLVLESVMGTDANGERTDHPSESQELRKKGGAISGKDHGSRFRALEDLDLNINLETEREGKEVQDEMEDSSHILKSPILAGGQTEAIIVENITEQSSENIRGKENIPQSTPSHP